MRFAKCLFPGAIVALCAQSAWAQSSLFYLEAQGVAGYSSAAKEAIYYSMSQDEAMQKPSLGFDWIRRLSGASGDFGSLGLQMRLAYNHEPDPEAEIQIYNAFFRYKAGFADVWLGHDRPAFGLSSYFDSHGLLLHTLGMMGYGFDRDWGAGVYRDFAWGNAAASITTGSGMPLEFEGNWLAAARVSRGVLNQENYNVGLSLAWGEPLMTMGYEVVSEEPYELRMAGIDAAWLWRRFESRVEIMAGQRMEEESYALFWRLGVNLLEENRLRLEAQPIFLKEMGESSVSLSAGISFQATADLAIRATYEYLDASEDNRIVAQVYYYKGM